MKLNERIYELRTKHKMSQGDLAEALGVSRQSVSKWEVGSAVPEIEHLLHLSEIFGVTLDELVKGEGQDEPRVQVDTEETQTATAITYREREPRKTAALVLLLCGIFLIFIALLGLGAIGILLAIPLFVCALLCVLLRRRVALYCGWATLILVDLFLGYTTGVMNSWWGYLRIALSGHTMPEGAALHIVISIFLTLCELGMITVTVYSYRNSHFPITKKRKGIILGGWGLWVVTRLAMGLPGYFLTNQVDALYVLARLMPFYHLLQTIGFTALLTLTILWIRNVRKKQA